MQTWSLQCTQGEYRKLVQCRENKPDILLIFAPQPLLKSKEFADFLKHELSDIVTIGCSSSGEIYHDHTKNNSIVALGITFKYTHVKFAEVPLEHAAMSYEAGQQLANAFNAEDLKLIFTLAPGVRINGSAFVRGIQENITQGATISGGLAGDGTAFEDTYVMLNGEISNQRAVAFALYGDALSITSGSAGGWEDFGPQRRVTQCEGSVLYALDNKPALPMYMQYIGNKAQELPSSALMFPFSVLDETGKGSGLIRTILNVDHEAQSITFAGELPLNSNVCLMHSDTDMLVAGAAQAAQKAMPDATEKALQDGDCAAILVSCVGRKLVMGEDMDEEIEAVHEVMDDDCTVVGFYSFGEIGELSGTKTTHFHNQTMTIVHFFEKQLEAHHA